MAALSPQSRGSVLTCKDTTNGSVEASDDRAERLLRLVLGSWTERVEGNQLPAEQDWEPDTGAAAAAGPSATAIGRAAREQP